MKRDQEEMARDVIDGMSGMLDLLHGLTPGQQIEPQGIAALLRLIHGAALLAIPDGSFLHPRAANDGDDG